MHVLELYLMYSSVLVATSYAADLTSRKQAFCGSRLTKIMSEFCIAYHSPPESRQKRQIISECCHNHCSLDYLLENYCKTIDTVALENFRSFGNVKRPIETTSSQPQPRNLRLSSQEVAEGIHRIHRKRGKRHCACRNRHKIKRMNKTIRLLRRVLLGKRRSHRIQSRKKENTS